MPRSTYVTIIDVNTMKLKTKRFNKMSEGVDYIKHFPCKGHILYAERYDFVIAFKSDTVGSNYFSFDKIKSGLL